MAADSGIEPLRSESKSDMLPLHQSAIGVTVLPGRFLMVLHKATSLASVFCHVTNHVQLLPTRMHLLPLYGDMFTPRPVSIYLDDLPVSWAIRQPSVA